MLNNEHMLTLNACRAPGKSRTEALDTHMDLHMAAVYSIHQSLNQLMLTLDRQYLATQRL